MTTNRTDNHKAQLDLLRKILRIRIFEERVLQLRLEGFIVGSVHLCIGQEAIPVGTCAVLGPQDVVFATYRGHGWAIACGTPLEALFAELMGRATGTNGGRAGSAYLSAPDYRFYGENSIVGAGAPIAVGAALASRYQGSNRVVISAFGDGAMNQGAVHEAMNFAAAFGLPVVFICENNRYSELTLTARMVRSDRFYERAVALGIPGQRVDGNDPEAVMEAVEKALQLARQGGGPSFIEAMTARLVGHYVGDPETYRAPGELDALRKVEPVAALRERLLASGVPREAIDTIEAEVRLEVDTAVKAALAAPLADPAAVREHLYG